MKKELILKEMDRIIFEEKQTISFRTLAANLNIAPSTISYQFSNQDNLYKEYLKFKLKQLITPQSLASFENMMIAFGHQLYELFQSVSKEVTFEMVDALIGSVVLSNFTILDSLFEKDYNYINRDTEIAIISNIIMAMVFSKNYSKILNNDLTVTENRERLIKNIILRELKD